VGGEVTSLLQILYGFEAGKERGNGRKEREGKIRDRRGGIKHPLSWLRPCRILTNDS